MVFDFQRVIRRNKCHNGDLIWFCRGLQVAVDHLIADQGVAEGIPSDGRFRFDMENHGDSSLLWGCRADL
jgi:hypothetical protein